MSEQSRPVTNLPPEQQAIRAKCFHPTGTFVEFRKEDIEQSIPERFEKIVRMHANRVAIKTDHQSFTYAEVNIAANRIANAIRAKLGQKTEPVTLLSDHGPGSIISCIGILKAGKILVAVDPAFPRERISYLLGHSLATAIVTDKNNLLLSENLATTERSVIYLDSVENSFSDEDLNLELLPDTPAEIRYSSGSTGQPKGIVRNHRRLLHSAALAINETHVCRDDHLLTLRHPSFGIRDILKALLIGARLCPFDIKKNNFADLARFIIQQEVTIYASVPSTFRYFTREIGNAEIFPSVRLIQLGAEPLSIQEVRSYKNHFSNDCILLHRLSCGEAGNICNYFIDKNTEIDLAVVPVGYPVAGKEILLLDESGVEVGERETGEIAVKSRYLSTEYWRQPVLTGAKFLPDPDSQDKRIYLTGDLGRKLPDGRLVYLGRKDLEVKIRGCTVAITEIETTLRGCAQVTDAAVKPWDDESGEKFLVAYIVSVSEPPPSTDELNNLVKSKLPEYMIPSEYVFLKSLPTANGKLDRHALPGAAKKRPNLRASFIAPRTPIEKELSSIWARILSKDCIGVHDNFFDLGGHSLSAVRVVSQVIKSFQLELPLQALFQAPTVAAMAAVIIECQGKNLGEKELARVLAEVESMSDAEAQRSLAEQSESEKPKD
jgi:non-ribosomal peptide synthetase component F/acyl carrier protein